MAALPSSSDMGTFTQPSAHIPGNESSLENILPSTPPNPTLPLHENTRPPPSATSDSSRPPPLPSSPASSAASSASSPAPPAKRPRRSFASCALQSSPASPSAASLPPSPELNGMIVEAINASGLHNVSSSFRGSISSSSDSDSRPRLPRPSRRQVAEANLLSSATGRVRSMLCYSAHFASPALFIENTREDRFRQLALPFYNIVPSGRRVAHPTPRRVAHLSLPDPPARTRCPIRVFPTISRSGRSVAC